MPLQSVWIWQWVKTGTPSALTHTSHDTWLGGEYTH